MTDIEAAWLAGLLEGEGCFQIRRTPKGSLQVGVRLNMCDRDVVERAAMLAEAAIVRTHVPKNPKHNTTHYFYISGNGAIRTMMIILPFMGERRTAKIKSIITVWDNSPHTRERYLPPACHPDRKHHVKGLCYSCFLSFKRLRRYDHQTIKFQ